MGRPRKPFPGEPLNPLTGDPLGVSQQSSLVGDYPQPKQATRKQKKGKRSPTTEVSPAMSTGPAPRIRYYIPRVAQHVAACVVKCAMDYEEAVRMILGDRADLVDVAEIAANLEKDEGVQAFVQEELTIHGLDDKSKEVYVRTLWDWFRSGSENKAMKAAGILGKGFIAEKVETTKPENLPIAGIGDAVNSMLGKSSGAATDDTTIKESSDETS